jgi:Flp pilus assembly pilin Flp
LRSDAGGSRLVEPAMTHALTLIANLARKDEGQDLLEYAMLMALIAVGAVVAVTQLGRTITDIFWTPIGVFSL